eukprot:TRINITY_DN55534_c0_g1_i1.p1 TRINITY_DN55534_c0_g1~~TRINITY_DN55534_c0_g1_i1.p1  ORF type:complete len:413 (+),score=84.71 TRINITY_DN55534_c0_g1_i1:51-1289(+)
MVDILKGNTPLATFAPLSHEQTVSVCRHLQEQIDSLLMRFQSLETHHGNTEASVQGVKQNLSSLNVESNFRRQNKEMRALNDSNAKDIQRAFGGLQQLKLKAEEATDHQRKLEEAQRASDLSIQTVAKDLLSTTAFVSELRATVEKKVFVDIEKLREDLRRTDLSVRNVQTEVELQRSGLQAQREEHRELLAEVQGLRADLGKTDSRAQMLEQRCGELTKGLKGVRQDLEETAAAVIRCRDDLEGTNAQVADVNVGVQKATTVAKYASDVSDRNSHALTVAQAQGGNTACVADSARTAVEQLKAVCKSLREGQERNAKQHSQLMREMEQLKLVMVDTKRSLAQTNSLVLPNLSTSLDGGSERGFMSMTMPTTARGSPKSPSGTSSKMGASIGASSFGANNSYHGQHSPLAWG